MPQVTGLGNTWNLPNYAGELFTADPTQTPFLSMIGGLSGGLQSNNDEFATGVLYDLPDATQPGISEQASATAPQASHVARRQETNVVQIHQEVIDLTYAKQSNSGKLSGLNIAGQQANPTNEKACAAIDEYFLELAMQWDSEDNLIVRTSEFDTRLMAITGISDISNIRLNGSTSNLILAANEIPIRGTVNG